MPKNLHDLCTTSCFLCLPSPVTQRSHLLGSCTIVASPKIRGGTKCSILGEQHYFVWDTASQRTKWLCSKNFGGSWPLGPPWLRLWAAVKVVAFVCRYFSACSASISVNVSSQERVHPAAPQERCATCRRPLCPEHAHLHNQCDACCRCRRLPVGGPCQDTCLRCQRPLCPSCAPLTHVCVVPLREELL